MLKRRKLLNCLYTGSQGYDLQASVTEFFLKRFFFCFRIESNASIECLEEGRMIRSREI